MLARLLDAGAYAGAGAVVQFLVRCGHDPACVVLRDELVVRGVEGDAKLARSASWGSDADADGGGGSLYQSILSLGGLLVGAEPAASRPRGPARPNATPNRLGAVLYVHAKRLLAELQLVRLHEMARECRVDLAKFLREDGAPRGLTRAIVDVHAKMGDDPGAVRPQVDFGLRNELGRNTEWCLVLATVLGRREMVAEQLLSNLSLWRTYRDAAYNAAGGAFGDFVDGVEALLEEEA